MQVQRLALIAAIVLSVGFVWLRGGFVGMHSSDHDMVAPPVVQQGFEVATFAAGCFWSVEAAFDKVPGVVSTTTGYTGGRVANPTYEQVVRGGTGHAEAVQVVFDPGVVTYVQLLDHFWRNIDPFVTHRQFCDVGDQYRPEIFVYADVQRVAAESSRQLLQNRFKRSIPVKVTNASAFYPAEAYHQDYHSAYPVQYEFYRRTCGREARLRQIWGDS